MLGPVVFYWAGPWDGRMVGPVQAEAPLGTMVALLQSDEPGLTGAYVMAQETKTWQRRAEWFPGTVTWIAEED